METQAVQRVGGASRLQMPPSGAPPSGASPFTCSTRKCYSCPQEGSSLISGHLDGTLPVHPPLTTLPGLVGGTGSQPAFPGRRAVKTCTETQRARSMKTSVVAPRFLWKRASEEDATYFQLAWVLPSDPMEERLLELAEECGGRASQDSARLCAPLPQCQATLPVRNLWDD